MNKILQTRRQLRVLSAMGNDALLLQHVSGVESLSTPYEYSLQLLSPDPQLDGQQVVGQRLTIEYFGEDGRTRHLDGFVSRFAYQGQSGQADSGDRYSVYTAQLVPWLWFLENRKDCRIFQEMSTPEIIRQVFVSLGFTDFKMELTDDYESREFCVQYRETDLNFVSRLMEEEGIYYYFTHHRGRHVLHLHDSVSGYYPLEDSEVQMGTGQGQGQFYQLSGWRHAYQFRPGQVAQKDFNFKSPQDQLVTQQSSRLPFQGSQNLEIFEYPGRYDQSGAGSRLTRIRMEELEARQDVVEAEGNYLSFSPGGRFKVVAHERDAERGKSFVITQIGLQINNNLGQNPGGVDFHNYFQCIPAETIFRPERRALKPVVEGMQTAIVTTDGQEIVVDEHARVKVQFHWDRYGKYDFQSSCWIRVSQVHAGKGWGMIDIPRKDEEVLVSFIDGDPDRPLITGRVYNGDNPVPFSLQGGGNNVRNKTRRGNTTRTVGGGGYNEMSMDDTPGAEEIRIHGQHDMNTVVGHDESHTVGNDRQAMVGHDETMSVLNNQSLTVGNDQVVSVGNNRQTSVGANDLECVEGAQTVNVAADQSTNVGASQNNQIAANQSNRVGNRQSNRIGVAKNSLIGAMANEMVGFVKTVNVGVAMNTIVGALNSEQTGGVKHIIAGTKFQVVCGASSLTMDAGGNITLQGTNILIDSSGPTKINGGPIDLN